MSPLRTRLHRDEGGWALVTAIILMSVMLATGLAFSSVVTTQQGASREQRERETAFNLAESALSAQLFSFSRPAGWPGSETVSYPACSQASVPPPDTTSPCPDDAQLREAFSSVDLDAAATWETVVRDNNEGSEDFYDDTETSGNAGFDVNRDGKVWVRARATAKGKTRTLVAMVRVYTQAEDVAKSAVIAGRMVFNNNGNKAIVLGAGPVIARCDPLAGGTCLGQPYERPRGAASTAPLQPPARLVAQLGGSTPVSKPTMPNAMTVEARERLKQTAISNGTYYDYDTGCPPGLDGAVIYIKEGDCRYLGNGTYNTAAAPGLVILESGTLEMKESFFGVIYHANLLNSAAEIVKIHGDGLITGGILVDGPGQLTVGASKENLQFDPNAFEAVKSYGTAGVIQNTWREIKSG